MKGGTGLGAVLVMLLALLYIGSAEADWRTKAAGLLLHYAGEVGVELPVHITVALAAKWLEDNMWSHSDHPKQESSQPPPQPKPLPPDGGTIARDDDARLAGLYSKLCTDKDFLARPDIDRRALEELGCQHRADLGFQVIALGENYKKLNLPFDPLLNLKPGVMVSMVNAPLLSTAEGGRKLDEAGREERQREEEDCRAKEGLKPTDDRSAMRLLDPPCTGGVFNSTVLSGYPANMLTNQLMVGDVISSLSLLRTALSPDERGWWRGNSLEDRHFYLTNPTDFQGVRLFAYPGAEIFLPILRIEDEGVRKEMVASLIRGIVPNLQREAGTRAGVMWPWRNLYTCLVVR
jgi:hypothetical protein